MYSINQELTCTRFHLCCLLPDKLSNPLHRFSTGPLDFVVGNKLSHVLVLLSRALSLDATRLAVLNALEILCCSDSALKEQGLLTGAEQSMLCSVLLWSPKQTHRLLTCASLRGKSENLAGRLVPRFELLSLC